MIAKIFIQLPYIVNIPEGEQFDIYEFQLDEYKIRFYPLRKSEDADKHSEIENLTMDGVAAYNADVLHINFYKSDFNRASTSDFDPPINLIADVANNFLLKLRFATSGFQIKPINISKSNFSIIYLNDDETELEKKEGFIRRRGGKKATFAVIGVNKHVWKDVHTLDPSRDLPAWRTLLLDASSVLPEVGPAIVLTFTALEVFISQTLDEIASIKKIDEKFWAWINDRSFFLKNPSIEEQYAFLSEHLIGKSIKDDAKLWQAFKNLQTIRNSFAHTGVASLGGKAVDEIQAIEFIGKAYEITEFIKHQLPDELQWRKFHTKIKFEGSIPLFKPPPDENKTGD